MAANCSTCDCKAPETDCKYYNVSYSDDSSWDNYDETILCSTCLANWIASNESKIILIRNIHNKLVGNP